MFAACVGGTGWVDRWLLCARGLGSDDGWDRGSGSFVIDRWGICLFGTRQRSSRGRSICFWQCGLVFRIVGIGGAWVYEVFFIVVVVRSLVSGRSSADFVCAFRSWMTSRCSSASSIAICALRRCIVVADRFIALVIIRLS